MTGGDLLIGFYLVFALVGFFVVFSIVVSTSESARLRKLFLDCLVPVLVSLWLLPVAYVAVGAYHWLLHGNWMSINLCYDADFLCGTGKALGVDKILQVMADSPFAVVVGITAAAYAVLFALLKDNES
jgi:hypothetical protein